MADSLVDDVPLHRRAASMWTVLTTHVNELMCFRLNRCKSKLLDATTDILAFFGATSSNGIGLLHTMVYDQWIKIGKSEIQRAELWPDPTIDEAPPQLHSCP